MAIFSKSISEINYQDLQELLDDSAVENLRLEFKRECPNKDEFLKKISSFSNTFGGYLIIGAEADSKDGRLTSFPGVDLQSGYKQRIVQWCFDAISPPIFPLVSDPIPISSNSDRVCYIVYIEESEQAPHFINGRKGIWIRTDEFSQRFEPKLATFNELQHLSSKREKVVERRTDLIQRAQDRLKTLDATHYSKLGNNSKEYGANFELSLIPKYPTKQICGMDRLHSLINEKRLPWRQVGFPRRTGGIISQHESIIVLRPGSSFSILEANIWGLLFYATEIENENEHFKGIHLYHFVGQLLVFLEHARLVYSELKYLGNLSVQMTLNGIRNVPWIYAEHNRPVDGPFSVLDDTVTFSLNTTTDIFFPSVNPIAKEILEFVLFATNWPDVAIDQNMINDFIIKGYSFNMWKPPNDLP
jgi:hypothetical protein